MNERDKVNAAHKDSCSDNFQKVEQQNATCFLKNERDVLYLKRRVGRGSSCLGSICAFIGVVVSLVWLSNIQMGFLFEIPDNLPLIGNLDEVFFTVLLLASLSYFGIEIPFLSRRYDVLLAEQKIANAKKKR